MGSLKVSKSKRKPVELSEALRSHLEPREPVRISQKPSGTQQMSLGSLRRSWASGSSQEVFTKALWRSSKPDRLLEALGSPSSSPGL
eukprot:9023264-Alexandrium_andersonii.AAC.1